MAKKKAKKKKAKAKVVKKKTAKKASKAKAKAKAKPKPPKEKRGGRKTGYSKACDRKALEFMAETPDLTKLAEKLKIGLTTLYQWQKDYVLFAEAITEGRSRFADQCEATLFELCKPHKVVSEKVKAITLEAPDGDKSIDLPAVEKETLTKKDFVSEKALDKVLKALKPELYGDKMHVTGTTNLTILDFSSVKQ